MLVWLLTGNFVDSGFAGGRDPRGEFIVNVQLGSRPSVAKMGVADADSDGGAAADDCARPFATSTLSRSATSHSPALSTDPDALNISLVDRHAVAAPAANGFRPARGRPAPFSGSTTLLSSRDVLATVVFAEPLPFGGSVAL